MRACAICAKSYKMAGTRRKLRGNYNPTNWSKKKANLQWTKIKGKRMRVCTRCLKTLSHQ